MKTIIGLAVLGMALAACGQRAAERASETAAQEQAALAKADAEQAREHAAAEQAEAAAEAAAQKQIAVYHTRLLSLFAGTYSGTCAQDSASAPGSITVGADGVARAAALTFNLHDGKGKIMVSRSFEAGKVVGAAAMADLPDQSRGLVLVSGKEESAVLTADGSAVKCEAVAQAAKLRAMRIYPAVADYFMAGSATLECAAVGDVTRTTLQVKAGPDGLTAGPHAYSFTRAVLTEVASVDASGAFLSYGVDYENGTKLMLGLDKRGKINEVIVAGKDDNLICSAKT